ncbi:MAG: DUF2341 domain-containing protein [Candidatus Bathyarchaeota archaeon]|nr:MAG: DUF2341 domain-containing protein [Candidatus Bathyarchaeota archaeon]
MQSKKFYALLFCIMFCASSILSASVLSSTNSIVSTQSEHTKDGNRVYIENDKVYISATPHTINADGYVYLNITSKTLEGNMDLCFGFDGNLAYPTSLEIYDPQIEVTKHELDLNIYDNEDHKIQLNYNVTDPTADIAYDGSVIACQKVPIDNEKNQTINYEWKTILEQSFDSCQLSTKMVYWTTTRTSEWTSIRENSNFEKQDFSFQEMNIWHLSNFTIEKNNQCYLRMWMTLVPSLENITREFLVALKPHDSSFEEAVAENRFSYLDPWYNANWQYRKSHVINNATGAGTNYPIKIIVHYGPGADAFGDVYLANKSQVDFDDIRFTDDDKVTLLDYWCESKYDSDNATFWVEIADSLSTVPVTIYMYYGNNYVARSDDGLGLDLFQIREYDKYYSYNPNYQFIKSTSSVLEADSSLSGSTPIGEAYIFIQAKKSYLDGKRIQMYWRAYFTYGGTRDLGQVYVVDNEHLRTKTTDEFYDNDNTQHPVMDYTYVNPLTLSNTGSGWTSWTTQTSDVLDLSSFSSDYVTILICAGDYWIQQTTILDLDYMKILDSSNNTLKTFDFTETIDMEQTGTYRDYGLYRKLVDPEPTHGDWGHPVENDTPTTNNAFIIWGTQHYPSTQFNYTINGINYTSNSAAELALSESVCDYVYDLVNDAQQYYIRNYWGDPTQEEAVYDNVSYCETNYNYTAIFYKGHFWTTTCPWSCGNTHYVMYDNSSATIIDYEINSNMTSGTHDFVFLWMCEVGGTNETGGIDANHSWGMLASWMDRDDLGSNGYSSPDGTDHVFISFENTSVDFCIPTGFDSYNYSHFAYLFFDYALNSFMTVNEALDAASEDVFNQADFGSTALYNGYNYTWYDPRIPGYVEDKCYLRIYGDGDHIIPN